jgi:GntR family transcriptional regulator / MocR family aminotransferase
MPDVSTFPRASWLRSVHAALTTMTDADLGYGDPRGVAELRAALADYLGRVRGVAAAPEQMVVTSGFWQGLARDPRRGPAAAAVHAARARPS